MGCSSHEGKIVYFAQKTVKVCSGRQLHTSGLKWGFSNEFQQKSISYIIFILVETRCGRFERVSTDEI